jgi:hypothetical protein
MDVVAVTEDRHVSVTAPELDASPAPTVRRLLRLAWPVVVSRSSQVVVGVTDAIMVAHLGEAALAATTTGATNTFNLLILPMGVVFIVASFAAQFTGEGNPRGARRYGWDGLGLALLTQAICLAGLPAVPRLLAAVGHGGEVLRLMSAYLTGAPPDGRCGRGDGGAGGLLRPGPRWRARWRVRPGSGSSSPASSPGWARSASWAGCASSGRSSCACCASASR